MDYALCNPDIHQLKHLLSWEGLYFFSFLKMEEMVEKQREQLQLMCN